MPQRGNQSSPHILPTGFSTLYQINLLTQPYQITLPSHFTLLTQFTNYMYNFQSVFSLSLWSFSLIAPSIGRTYYTYTYFTFLSSRNIPFTTLHMYFSIHSTFNWKDTIGFRMCDSEFAAAQIEWQIVRLGSSMAFDHAVPKVHNTHHTLSYHHIIILLSSHLSTHTISTNPINQPHPHALSMHLKTRHINTPCINTINPPHAPCQPTGA